MADATHFTNFDYIIIAVMVFSCVFAYFRGLVREILSLAAWIGAGIVTIYYFPAATAALQQHFKSQAVAAAIAGVGIYLLALVGFGLINMIIIKSFKSGSESGVLDNMLGLLFGACRGALMVSLGFFMLTKALPEKEYPDWLKQSVTRPYVAKGADVLARLAPEYMHDISTLEKKAESEAETPPAAPDATNPAPAPVTPGADQNTGYTRTTTQQLDRLIQGTGNP